MQLNELMSNFSMNYFALNGKVALVTGGNKGIGMAYSIALAKAGADIFLVHRSEDNLEEIQKSVEELGSKFKSYKVDLGIYEEAIKVIDNCVADMGSIDILVNNAGMIKRNPIEEYKDEDWRQVIDVNLNSVYYLSKYAVQYMIKQGHGKIINIASMLSFQGGKFVPPYTASKHGVAGITKAFANELASKNIQVNAIAPGYISTDNTKPIREDVNRNKEILGRIPAGRWGEASDLMGTVVFLASRASDYVNGHILAVDGGWLVR